MRAACTELGSPLAEPIRCFLATKRALNRRFDTEEKALHLLDRHLSERGVVHLEDVTPAVVDAFLTSRPRQRPRSYNHLLGVLRRLFDWMVDQGMLVTSPHRLRPRRETARRIPYLFDLPHACRLIEVAAALRPCASNGSHDPTLPRASGAGAARDASSASAHHAFAAEFEAVTGPARPSRYRRRV